MLADDAGRAPLLNGRVGWLSLHTQADPTLLNELTLPSEGVAGQFSGRVGRRWGMQDMLDVALMESHAEFTALDMAGITFRSLGLWSAQRGGVRWAYEDLGAPVTVMTGQTWTADRGVRTLPMVPFNTSPGTLGIGFRWLAFAGDGAWAAFGSLAMARKLGLINGWLGIVLGDPRSDGVEPSRDAGYHRTRLTGPYITGPQPRLQIEHFVPMTGRTETAIYNEDGSLYLAEPSIQSVAVPRTTPVTIWQYNVLGIWDAEVDGNLLGFTETSVGRRSIGPLGRFLVPSQHALFGWRVPPGQWGGQPGAETPIGTLGSAIIRIEDSTPAGARATFGETPVEQRIRAGTGPVIVQVYEQGGSPRHPAVTLYTVASWELTPAVELTKALGPRGTPVRAVPHVKEQKIRIVPQGETRAFIEAGRLHGGVREIPASTSAVARLMGAFAVGAALHDRAGLELALSRMAFAHRPPSGVYEIRTELVDAGRPQATATLWHVGGQRPFQVEGTQVFAAGVDATSLWQAGVGTAGDTATVLFTADAEVAQGVEITFGDPRALVYRVLAMSEHETGNEWATLTADACVADESTMEQASGAVPEIPLDLVVLGADARLVQTAFARQVAFGGYQTPLPEPDPDPVGPEESAEDVLQWEGTPLQWDGQDLTWRP